jgi:hypothetical protein
MADSQMYEGIISLQLSVLSSLQSISSLWGNVKVTFFPLLAVHCLLIFESFESGIIAQRSQSIFRDKSWSQ